MDAKQLALVCRELADRKKAEDLTVLDLRQVSTVTDYFVIGTGSSEPHLRAIVEEITDRLRTDYHVRPRAVDGTLQAGWVVLDFFDVIVHIMRGDQRHRYDLEGLWGDAPRVRGSAVRKVRQPAKRVSRPRKPGLSKTRASPADALETITPPGAANPRRLASSPRPSDENPRVQGPG
jgi:ribosome-associated protein